MLKKWTKHKKTEQIYKNYTENIKHRREKTYCHVVNMTIALVGQTVSNNISNFTKACRRNKSTNLFQQASQVSPLRYHQPSPVGIPPMRYPIRRLRFLFRH